MRKVLSNAADILPVWRLSGSLRKVFHALQCDTSHKNVYMVLQKKWFIWTQNTVQ